MEPIWSIGIISLKGLTQSMIHFFVGALVLFWGRRKAQGARLMAKNAGIKVKGYPFIWGKYSI
jgi:hypothetical protein